MVIKVLQRRKSQTARRRNKDDEPVDQDDIDDAATALELALHESTPHHTLRDVGTASKASTAAQSRPRSLSPLANPLPVGDMASVLERTSSVKAEVRDDADDKEDARNSELVRSNKQETNVPSVQKAVVPPSSTPSKSKAKAKAPKLNKSLLKSNQESSSNKRKKEEVHSKPWIKSFQKGTADSGDATLPPLQIRVTAALLTGLVATTKRSSNPKGKDTMAAKDLVTGYVRVQSCFSCRILA
jgi:hypothetical protein